MGKVYESLKEVVTLQRSKNDPVGVARVKHTQAPSLDEETNGLEKLIVQKIDGWKASVNQGEEVVEKVQGGEQVIGTLRENLALLQTNLKEIEETFRIKDFASKEMEESLTANIHGLQDELNKNKETLQSRDNEINNLKSNADVLVRQVTELELAIKHAKAKAETVANRTREMTERSNSKIAELEGQIRDKESAIKALEENLTPKTEEFESQLKNKETLLAARDAEINELKSQLHVLTRGIKEMSSFVNQAEASADVGGKSAGTISASEPVNGMAAKPAVPELKTPLVTSKAPHAPQQTVPPMFFDLMTRELTPVKGPVASMTVRDHVTALGESMEKFPRSRVPELLELLSKEIPNEDQKIVFRKWFVKHV